MTHLPSRFVFCTFMCAGSVAKDVFNPNFARSFSCSRFTSGSVIPFHFGNETRVTTMARALPLRVTFVHRYTVHPTCTRIYTVSALGKRVRDRQLSCRSRRVANGLARGRGAASLHSAFVTDASSRPFAISLVRKFVGADVVFCVDRVNGNSRRHRYAKKIARLFSRSHLWPKHLEHVPVYRANHNTLRTRLL